MTPITANSPSTQQRVSKYWRSLDQLENSPEFQEFLHREFPQQASELPEGISRRRWLQLMGASFTLAAAQGCRWQTEKFAAFADRPEGYVPGAHTKFATSIELAGTPRHLLVTCYDGRPIKIEGNPQHPSSKGGADTFAQAATLALYDPDRKGSQTASAQLQQRDGRETFSRSWRDFERFAQETTQRLAPKSGAGLAVLMQPTGSLATNAAVARLQELMPETAIFQYAPLGRDNEMAGAEMAFGGPVRTHYKLADADVIATFDADPLTSMPDSVAMARAFAERREPNKDKNEAGMSRLYAVESQFSVTGAAADHRLPLKSSAIPALLAELRDLLTTGIGDAPQPAAEGQLPDYRQAFVFAMAEDLAAAKGKSVVIVGPRQSAEAHAIAHEINAWLANVGQTVVYTKETAFNAEAGSLADLLGEIAAKRVDTLVVLGGNPVYDAPADLDLAKALASTPHTIHLSDYDNETSRVCHWSLPEAHPLEAWGDAPAWDGTASVSQPLVEPLLGGRSALELLALLADGPDVEAQQLVRDAVGNQLGGLDDKAWKKLVHDGFYQAEGTPADASAIRTELVRTGFEAGGAASEAADADGLELVFTPSSHTFDGRFANNGWLQETPDFITKLVWDNAALVAPATAAELGLEQGKLATITAGERKLDLPVFVLPGQAEGSIGVALGYGRTAAGRVGGMVNADGTKGKRYFVEGLRGNWSLLAPDADPIGADSYELRSTKAMDIVRNVEITSTGRDYLLASTQDHHAIDDNLANDEIDRRSDQLIREATQENYDALPDFATSSDLFPHTPDVKLWNELTHDDGRAWGMAIDLNKCVGCNACSVACQAENNVPVVGKDQVSRGREMHWIRIDRYFGGRQVDDGAGGKTTDFSNPTVSHQPLTCQHCETAPCEQVCPVAATVHSDEGLNDMAYNRCIGTRYCANNCPFKVRRFNFFNYTHRFEQASNELMQLVMNPEVTVRGRGVMEKCTYCTQRISAGRIEAKNEGRAIRDGDIVTACQQACPTQAIVFGDLKDENSQVAAWHKDQRAYTLLDGLRLKPRTKYLARIRNPHALLAAFLDMHTHQKGHTHEKGHGHSDGHGHDDGHGDGHGDGHSEQHPEQHATKHPSKLLLDLPIVS